MAYRTIYKGRYGEVREYSPCKRTITFFGKSYFLQFPYLIFCYHGCNLYVAFSLKQIESLYDVVFGPTLGNIYDRCRICGCDGSIDESIRMFWQKDFTTDGYYHENLIKTFGPRFLLSRIVWSLALVFNWLWLLRRGPIYPTRFASMKLAHQKWAKMTKKGLKEEIFKRIEISGHARSFVSFCGHFILDDEENCLVKKEKKHEYAV